MKSIPIRVLQHRLAWIFNLIEDGEEIQVTRRGRLVAKIVPAPKVHPKKWPNFMARLKETFPGKATKDSSQAFWDKMRKDRF